MTLFWVRKILYTWIFSMTIFWVRKILYIWNFLSINRASVENACFREMQCMHICAIDTVFLHKIKMYTFPIVELAKNLYWNPYYM